MSSTDLIECPICCCKITSSKINSHVEACLSKQDHCSTRNSKKNGNIRNQNGDREFYDANQQQTSKKEVASVNLVDDGRESEREMFNSTISLENEKANKSKLQGGKTKCSPSGGRSISDVLGKRKNADKPQTGSVEPRKKMKIQENNTTDKVDIPKLPTFDTGTQFEPAKHEKIQDTTPSKKFDLTKSIPLAEQLRPTNFDDYFGQDEMVGENTTLRTIIKSEKIPSMILWGPPGCGKTSLVNIIAKICKNSQNKRLVKLSATTSGINDVKDAVKVAQNELAMFKRETVLFIDEIHRFNKLQQDYFLPFVENGTITLLGATTENPSFQVNSALLSRCKVIVLKKHTTESLMKILHRAVVGLGGAIVQAVPPQHAPSEDGPIILECALETLANLCDGDARAALNGLEMAFNMHKSRETNACIDSKEISSIFQRSHVLYDKKGEEHYNMISALHKSIRGSDDNAALYWLARMLVGGEDPLYIARRLIRIASEDIGLADSSALQKAVSTFQACHFIGLPECEINLAHMVVYLARAPKSVEIYKAYNAAKSNITSWKGSLPNVPLHLRNAPTRLMKELGYAKEYKYNPDYDGPVEQDYLPKELLNVDFFAHCRK